MSPIIGEIDEAEEEDWTTGYGFFPGGDPRKFTPDEEMNTAEEIKAWELACDAWNNGNEEVIEAGCVLVDGMLVNITRLGMGTYTR